VIRLYEGLKICDQVMQHSLSVLSHMKKGENIREFAEDKSGLLEPVQAKEHYNALPRFSIALLDGQSNGNRLVSVFNPVARKRIQLVSVYVSTHYVKVSGEVIK